MTEWIIKQVKEMRELKNDWVNNWMYKRWVTEEWVVDECK